MGMCQEPQPLSSDEFLRRAVESLAKFDDPQQIYDYIANCLHDYTGAVITGLALCDDDHLLGVMESVHAKPELIATVEKIIARSVVGSPIAIPLALRNPSSLNVISWEKDIYPRAAKSSSKAPFANIGRAFGLSNVYGFPFRYAGQLYAMGGLVFRQGKSLGHDEAKTVELLMRLAAMALRPFLVHASNGQTIVVREDVAERQYRAAVNQNDMAILLIEHGRVLDCNPQAGAVLGRSPDLIRGSMVTDLLSTDGHLGDGLDAVAPGQTQIRELPFDHPQHGARLLELHLLPLTLPAGRPMIQMTAQDITERRRMEEAVRESEARHRELFETSHDGIVIEDNQGRLVNCNQAFAELVGYDTADQLRGLHHTDLTPAEYHDLDRDKKELLSEGNFKEYEKEYCRKSGERVSVWVRIWERRDARGRPIGSWALVRDITTVRQIESDITTIEKFRLLGELAAAISHEIRNPLTTVRGFLQLMSSRTTCPPEDKEFFALMISEVDSATTIIKDFLDMARPAGPRREVFSLSELLASLARIMESKAIMQKVQVQTQIEPGVEILGDPAQLRQVYVNLLQNAFQAMPSGGSLTLQVGRNGDKAIVRIGDTGVGIPAENLDRIGKPFFTTRPTGTGLGLTTCYRIIASHVGHIIVQSKVGVGTTFIVQLPCQ